MFAAGRGPSHHQRAPALLLPSAGAAHVRLRLQVSWRDVDVVSEILYMRVNESPMVTLTECLVAVLGIAIVTV